MTTRTQPRIGHRHLAPAARRRLPALALIACALSWLGAGAARADVSGPEIVGYVNAQRAANAIPAGIAQDAALSDGCAKHDAYMRLNNQVGHGEDPAKPGYTPQGNDVSSGPSVLYRGGPWSATRNPFETAPIHLHQLLAPRLDRMGAAEVQTYGCATTASRNRAAPAAFTTYSYPGDGATAWPFGQLAADQPYTPGMQVGIPAGTRTGPYLYVMFDGPTLTQSDIASATSATLTGPAGAVDVARVDNTTPGLAGYLPIGMQVIPRAPLQPNTTYTASISANVTTQGGTGPQRTLGRTWSFTTDALPDTMITAGPPSLTNSTSASVSFSSTKPGSTFLCRRDTASWQVCSNPATLTGLSDGPHTFSVRATDAGGNADPTEATRTWTVDTAPPAAVTLSASGPASPANGNLPKVSGTAEPGSTVRLYGDAACAGPILASGPAAALASPGLTIAVADDSSTTLRATATDPAGNASACSSSALTYVEDSTAPVAATLSSTDPASPSNVGTPKVRGTAEAGSTVRLYADTSCIGALLASGPAAEFASSGLAVAVAPGRDDERARDRDRRGRQHGGVLVELHHLRRGLDRAGPADALVDRSGVAGQRQCTEGQGRRRRGLDGQAVRLRRVRRRCARSRIGGRVRLAGAGDRGRRQLHDGAACDRDRRGRERDGLLVELDRLRGGHARSPATASATATRSAAASSASASASAAAAHHADRPYGARRHAVRQPLAAAVDDDSASASSAAPKRAARPRRAPSACRGSGRSGPGPTRSGRS